MTTRDLKRPNLRVVPDNPATVHKFPTRHRSDLERLHLLQDAVFDFLVGDGSGEARNELAKAFDRSELLGFRGEQR